MRLGAGALAVRGSGGARLSVSGEPIPFADELAERGSGLGSRLVARSSTLLESSGQWSGAFASYLELAPAELPKAVTGCWASAFSVEALDRQHAASIEPGSFPMAVLIQPALDPVAGGTAHVDPDGTVTVHGVKGSPAPLLQGWSTVHQARVSPPRSEATLGGVPPLAGRGALGSWTGDELIELLGIPILDRIATLIRQAQETTGAGRCEWALDGQVWLLQLDDLARTRPSRSPPAIDDTLAPDLARVARTVIRAPGRLGDELVLPWALAGMPRSVPTIEDLTPDALPRAREMCSRLTAQTWEMPPEKALLAARACIKGVLGPDPKPALDRIRRLLAPDPARSAWLVAVVEALQRDDDSSRRGVGRWEPFVASVVISTGDHHQGTAASAGIGAGMHLRIDHAPENDAFISRRVISAQQPIPNLAALLWDAAGMVTAAGSPAAHLFESARALGVPGVCGVTLPDGDHIVAVDGYNGVVSTLSSYGDDDV